MIENELGRAVFHVHTTASDGRKNPAECLELARKLRFDILVIADHDTLEGSLKAKKLVERQDNKSVLVWEAAEVSSAQGHVVAVGVSEEVPMYKSLHETVKIIHEKGGLAIATHVGKGPSPASIAPQTIDNLYQRGEHLDGIEVKHPCYEPRHAQRAWELSLAYNLARIGADDDHHGNLGRGPRTLFPGKKPEDLRRAIEKCQTVAVESDLPLLAIPFRHKIYQIARGLTWGLPRKLLNSPSLAMTLITLRLEELSKFFK